MVTNQVILDEQFCASPDHFPAQSVYSQNLGHKMSGIPLELIERTSQFVNGVYTCPSCGHKTTQNIHNYNR